MLQKINKEKTSVKILNTAFECLAANGYANVSMRNIADEAGVALSQLAYYYKNKENLFSEVINIIMVQYLNEIEDTLKSSTDAKDKLALLVRYFKELIRNHPKRLRLFIDFTAQALWIPSFRKQLDTLFNAIIKIIERNLPNDKITENKSLPEYSSESIAKLVFGTLFGTSIQIMLGISKDSVFDSLNLAESLRN